MLPSVWITGATRGIGLALAEKFYAQGHTLVLTGSKPESIAPLKIKFPTAQLFAANLEKPEEVHKLAEIWKSLPPPDIFINNAGKFLPGAIHQEPEGTLETLLQLNVMAPYHLTRAVLPQMMQAKSGTIINVCSIASVQAYPNGGSYCISKFALLGMSKVLREELKPHGIRVISLLPGATLTDAWAGSGLPSDRFISPQDLADLTYTLATLPSTTVVEEVMIRPLLGDI
jgi:short-subunit dehydrogenase